VQANQQRVQADQQRVQSTGNVCRPISSIGGRVSTLAPLMSVRVCTVSSVGISAE
jgi:hypothetical protein